jgi:hypothetical protein
VKLLDRELRDMIQTELPSFTAQPRAAGRRFQIRWPLVAAMVANLALWATVILTASDLLT